MDKQELRLTQFTVLYYSVLYCTLLYCILLYPTIGVLLSAQPPQSAWPHWGIFTYSKLFANIMLCLTDYSHLKAEK